MINNDKSNKQEGSLIYLVIINHLWLEYGACNDRRALNCKYPN